MVLGCGAIAASSIKLARFLLLRKFALLFVTEDFLKQRCERTLASRTLEVASDILVSTTCVHKQKHKGNDSSPCTSHCQLSVKELH